ncbi:hypothetical protein SCALM49S_04582 [Streptomyces californicus]
MDGVKIEKITTLAARMVAGGAPVESQALDDQEELDLYKMCLGDQYDVLLTDLRWSRFKHVAITAMMWITVDRRPPPSTGRPGRSRKTESRGTAEVGRARLLGKGCGEYDEATGLYEWYEDGIPAQKAQKGGGPQLTWAGLLEQRALIEADFQQTYGIDLDTPGLMRARSWRRLRPASTASLRRPGSTGTSRLLSAASKGATVALTVGELVGFIRLDDGEARPALRRAEGDLNASGQRMADDAEQAGQQAGQALGDGFTRAADGSIRDARGRFVSAARRSGDAAGDALGDALRDGARDGADDAVQAAEGGLSRLQTIAAGAGVAAGAALVVGITDYLAAPRSWGRWRGRSAARPRSRRSTARLRAGSSPRRWSRTSRPPPTPWPRSLRTG